MRRFRLFLLVPVILFLIVLAISQTPQLAAQGNTPQPFPQRTILPPVPTIIEPTLIPTRIPTTRTTFTPVLTPTGTATPSQLNVLTVNQLEDTNDGVCDAKDCSLREAIANAASGATINFAQGLTGTILVNRTLEITKNLNITGPGQKSTILEISSNNAARIFFIKSSAGVNVSNLRIAGGNNDNIEGGGIYVQSGTVTIDKSSFQDNRTTSGGAIYNVSGVITITNSTFEGNRATTGGAIFNGSGTVNIANSTFKDNRGTGGGAISNLNGKLTIANSTFDSNRANSGGAIFNDRGIATIASSTFYGNSFGGSGTFFNNTFAATATLATAVPGTITLKTTIIDGSTGKVNCEGSVIDGGNNLQFPRADCGKSIPVGDPKLGPLADNGGTTWTMALQPGSAAIGKIAANNCSVSDQRGMARPANNATCDIGAFQSGDVPQP